MTSYLLLRNNKESGPHSFEQLLGFGLKPYDLVWVNGKSAAWRYPSEIEELKSFVPGEVEQPFDRFYKKPAGANGDLQSPNSNAPVTLVQHPNSNISATVSSGSVYSQHNFDSHQEYSEIPAQGNELNDLYKQASPVQNPILPAQSPKTENTQHSELNDFTPYEQRYLPRKSVHVSLPEPAVNNNYQSSESYQLKNPVQITQQAIPNTGRAIPDYAGYSDEKPTISITENPETAKVKYSQPLDEIKDMYVKTLQQRKDRIARQTFFKINLKRVAAVAGLIGIGLLAGYILKTGKPIQVPGTLAVNNNSTPAQTPPATNEEIVNEQTQPGSNTQDNKEPRLSNQPHQEILTAKPLASNQLPAPEMKQQVAGNRDRLVNKPATDQLFESEKVDYTPVTTNDLTGERSRAVRSDIPQSKNTEETPQRKPTKITTNSTKSALGKQVLVTTNDYKRVAFGGIRNLELTVTNNSKYELDNVLVELEYIKPNEEILKMETFRFTGIAPSEAATIRVPDNNRGIRVEYRIVSIGSRQFNADVASQ